MFSSAERNTYSDQISYIGQPPDINGEDVDIYLARVGRFHATRFFRKHTLITHSYCHIITKGQVHISLDGKEDLLKAGDIAVFFEGQYSIINDNCTDESDYVFLDFHGLKVQDIFNSIGISSGKQCFKGRFHELLEPFLREVESAYKEDQYSALFPTVAAWRFIGLISSELGVPAKQKKLRVAEIAKQIINQEFYRNTSIEEIAARLEVSRITLFRQFKNEYGLSPKKYMDNQRMKKACQLLSCSRLQVSQVAYDCGYESIQHFNRMFRLFYEISPSEYRKRNRS